MNDGHGELNGEVVPFGKYKGRPVAELVADDGYRDWVLAQPWVRERFVNFYNILVQGTPVAQDSPEHNEMQARFLDEDWCTRLMRSHPLTADGGLGKALDEVDAWKSHGGNRNVTSKYEIVPAMAADVVFEKDGWDVYFHHSPAFIKQRWMCECAISYNGDKPPPWNKDNSWYAPPRWSDLDGWRQGQGKPLEPDKPYVLRPEEPQPPPQQQDWLRYQKSLQEYPAILAAYSVNFAEKQVQYERKLASYQKQLAEYSLMQHYALDHHWHENEFGYSSYGQDVAAELKPDLGDDYPAVLRQVKGYLTRRESYGRGQYRDEPTCDVAFVVARRAQFRSVTWGQVQQVFAASKIILIREADI